jgi:hypothetical protein
MINTCLGDPNLPKRFYNVKRRSKIPEINNYEYFFGECLQTKKYTATFVTTNPVMVRSSRG